MSAWRRAPERDAREDNQYIHRPDPPQAPSSLLEPKLVVEEVRETGVVDSMRAAFGFIRCAERNEDLRFSTKSLVDQERPLRAGDEVEFDVQTDLNTNKRSAGRVELLPKGTVQFEKVLERKCKGIVQRPLQGVIPRGNRRVNPQDEPYGGFIRCVRGPPEENKSDVEEQVYEFSYRDVVNPRHIPGKDDEVEFDIFVEKRSGRKGATRVTLTAPTLRDGQERAEGIVTVLKTDFGFMRSLASETGKYFFHMSEFLDPAVARNLRVGDELAFTPSTGSDGRDRALQLTLLPKGTVQFSDPVDGAFTGRVTTPALQPPSGGGGGHPRHRQKKTQAKPGSIEIVSVSDGGDETLIGTSVSFSFKDSNVELFAGDEVSFTLSRDKVSQRLQADKLELVLPSVDGIEQGAIATMRPDFGFISRVTTDSELFFHVSQVVDTGVRLHPGTEVSFRVGRDAAGKEHASRVTVLPAGSVQFYTLSPHILQGRIERVAAHHHNRTGGSFFDRRRKPQQQQQQQQQQHRGRIRVQQDDSKDDDGKEVEYSVDDLVDQQARLRKGDVVEFQLQTKISSGRESATNVRLVALKGDEERYKGVVVAAKQDFGFLQVVTPEYKGKHNVSKGVYFRYDAIIENAEPVKGVPVSSQPEEPRGARPGDARRSMDRHAPRVHIGAAFEFSIEAPRSGKIAATRVVPIDLAALEKEVLGDDAVPVDAEGVVVVDASAPGPRSRSRGRGRGGRGSSSSSSSSNNVKTSIWFIDELEKAYDAEQEAKEAKKKKQKQEEEKKKTEDEEGDGDDDGQQPPKQEDEATQKKKETETEENDDKKTEKGVNGPPASLSLSLRASRSTSFLRRGDRVKFQYRKQLSGKYMVIADSITVQPFPAIVERGGERLTLKALPQEHHKWLLSSGPKPRPELLMLHPQDVVDSLTLKAGDEVVVQAVSAESSRGRRSAKRVSLVKAGPEVKNEESFLKASVANRERLEKRQQKRKQQTGGNGGGGASGSSDQAAGANSGDDDGGGAAVVLRMAKGPDGTRGFH